MVPNERLDLALRNFRTFVSTVAPVHTMPPARSRASSANRVLPMPYWCWRMLCTGITQSLPPPPLVDNAGAHATRPHKPTPDGRHALPRTSHRLSQPPAGTPPKHCPSRPLLLLRLVVPAAGAAGKILPARRRWRVRCRGPGRRGRARAGRGRVVRRRSRRDAAAATARGASWYGAS